MLFKSVKIRAEEQTQWLRVPTGQPTTGLSSSSRGLTLSSASVANEWGIGTHAGKAPIHTKLKFENIKNGLLLYRIVLLIVSRSTFDF